MKYSELKKIVEKYKGLKIKINKNYAEIYDDDFNSIYLYFDGTVNFDIDSETFPPEIIKAVADVMATPLEEREEPKLYCVHLLPGQNGYLNIDENDGEVFVEDTSFFDSFKTRFTQAEINALADKYPNTAIPHFDKSNPMFEEVEE